MNREESWERGVVCIYAMNETDTSEKAQLKQTNKRAMGYEINQGVTNWRHALRDIPFMCKPTRQAIRESPTNESGHILWIFGIEI